MRMTPRTTDADLLKHCPYLPNHDSGVSRDTEGVREGVWQRAPLREGAAKKTPGPVVVYWVVGRNIWVLGEE